MIKGDLKLPHFYAKIRNLASSRRKLEIVRLIMGKHDADATAPHHRPTPEQHELVMKVFYTLGKRTQYLIFLQRMTDVGLLLLSLYLWFSL